MREDEWCVRMRLRPDCGGISRGGPRSEGRSASNSRGELGIDLRIAESEPFN